MRPVLFYIPIVNLPIFSYGVMLGLSLVVGWYIVLPLCERDGMDREDMGKMYVETAIASVVSARLLYIFTNWDSFSDNLIRVFFVWEGGLVAYGGFIGGFIWAIFGRALHNYRLLAWADCVVPSLGTGLAITRIGCFLFGCDFGKVVEKGSAAAAWAVQFPAKSPAWSEQVKHGLITATAQQSLPVHPTQIYEALFGLSLFGVTLLVRRFRTFTGQMFVAFTMAYAVGRYFIETLRADEQRGEIGPLSTSQFIGIVTFLLAAVLYVVLHLRERRNPGSGRLWDQPGGGVAVPVAEAPAPKKRRRKR